jgi:phosphatidylglycerophosphate synthase
MSTLRRLPWALVWLRLMLAPLMLFLARYWPTPIAFALCLALAFFSDICDGVLARRWGTVTAGLRRFDSFADTLFCLGALGAVWICRPQTLQGVLIPLSVLLGLEVRRYVVDLSKFGREASYHMWSSKLWAGALFLAFFMLLVAGQDGPWVTVAILLGIVSDVEGLLVSLLLREWRHDVPSVVHALRWRYPG